MMAAMQGHSSIIRIMLNRGASASIAKDDGDTALNMAARNGHSEVVTALGQGRRRPPSFDLSRIHAAFAGL